MNKPTMYIAYYRVSTGKQEKSGLGIDAQRAIVQSYVESNGGILAHHVEESISTRRKVRPLLQSAIQDCKDKGAVLIVAKLDRLGRNVGELFDMKKNGVEFVACDLPDTGTLSLGMYALIAQNEREKISERTSSALQAKIKRDGKWQTPISNEAREKSIQTRREIAGNNLTTRKAKSSLSKSVKLDKHEGVKRTLQEYADMLNDEGNRTPRGKLFTPMQVSRLL
jgi:DNA invertase Pin-like site-specific DNA recombinase